MGPLIFDACIVCLLKNARNTCIRCERPFRFEEKQGVGWALPVVGSAMVDEGGRWLQWILRRTAMLIIDTQLCLKGRCVVHVQCLPIAHHLSCLKNETLSFLDRPLPLPSVWVWEGGGMVVHLPCCCYSD